MAGGDSMTRLSFYAFELESRQSDSAEGQPHSGSFYAFELESRQSGGRG